jgi:glycosyltransferase involved in cell wall biosynthesis
MVVNTPKKQEMTADNNTSKSPSDNADTANAPSMDYSHVAVLVPCYNEEVTVAKVVKDFQKALPGSTVYVFDNNSSDRTSEIAKKEGAVVVASPRQGKGNVIQHMFDDVEADIYIMIDGDDTYEAKVAPELIQKLIDDHADMVVGTRMSEFREKSFRRFHEFGNHLISTLIRTLFSIEVSDVLSGYRVFSRRFVKTVPLTAEGFEIETELTLQAAAKHYRVVEHPTEYGERPDGSESKLNTYSDGYLIIKTIITIFKDYKPGIFFFSMAGVLAILSLAIGSVPVIEFMQTGLVTHFPLAGLAASVGILAALSAAVGLVLSTVNRYHLENFKLWRRQLSKKNGQSTD